MRGVYCLHSKIRHLENVFWRVTHIDSKADGDLLTHHHHLVKEEGPAVAAGTEQDQLLSQCCTSVWTLNVMTAGSQQHNTARSTEGNYYIRSLLPGTPEDIERLSMSYPHKACACTIGSSHCKRVADTHLVFGWPPGSIALKRSSPSR